MSGWKRVAGSVRCQEDEMKIEFQSKHPHRTLFLNVTHRPDEGDVFRELEHALGLVHWVRDPWEIPPLPDGTMEIRFCRSGTGIFGGWTDEERIIFEAGVRNTLGPFMSGRVPHRKLRMQDCV